MPIGKRPRPAVAGTGTSPSPGRQGAYSGKSGNKAPTGSRPRPSVAKNAPSVPGKGRKTARPIKHTSMPAPNTKHAGRGGGKPNGG
jgi:hypothetical protein